jgi:hypothetical protein
MKQETIVLLGVIGLVAGAGYLYYRHHQQKLATVQQNPNAANTNKTATFNAYADSAFKVLDRLQETFGGF